MNTSKRTGTNFHPDSPRIVAEIIAGNGHYILKGIPDFSERLLRNSTDSLWKILKFGLEQKPVLWKMIKST